MTTWCSDCHMAKSVFDEEQVPYKSVNIDHEPEAAEIVEKLTNGYHSVPTIVFPNGDILVEPSRALLKAKLESYKKK